MLNPGTIERVVGQLAALRQQLAADPMSLTQPNVVPLRDLQQVLEAVEQALLDVWQRFVAVPEGDGWVSVLEANPQFRGATGRLRQLQAQWRRLAERLPADAADLAGPEELRRTWVEQVQGLGLEDDVLRLLTRAQNGGVPLAVLLDDEDLLQRLREHSLLACFRVVT
jgi:hypothetical protein